MPQRRVANGDRRRPVPVRRERPPAVLAGEPQTTLGAAHREGHGEVERQLREPHRRSDRRGLVGAHRIPVRLDSAREGHRRRGGHRCRDGLGTTLVNERGRICFRRFLWQDQYRR